MKTASLSSLLKHLESLPDPRHQRNRKHLLVDVVAIAVCGVLVGCDGPTAIRLWAEQREDWLRGFLALPAGLPSKDCLRRVLSRLKPDAFAKCFAQWVAEGLARDGEGRLIAIDGKTLRRSHDKKNALGPLHVVSAWASEAGFSLGQLATDEKSNEITAIPELLDAIDLEDAVVTIDAMGCQKEIAEKIVKEKGDYVLALKGNHEKLHVAVIEHFVALHERSLEGTDCRRRQTQGRGHGRVERREYYQTPLPDSIKPLAAGWKGLKTIGQVVSITERDGKETSEVRYYLSSLSPGVKRFAEAVRGHWAIENSLHWVLDVTFREDESRSRDRRLAENLAALRRLAIGLLKQHPSKHSLKSKQRIAGWNVDFLTQVLALQTT
ncbi:ISAs1 family transposase [Botrimarina mediterranea]|uniref:ISAs1 family transposase n=1 Tax=Botrimarina mediterranea TaxID=2528022 RepID=UPI00118A2C7F|nr:Transposase DDE domain protein [Planctomycetes bacterium K2D]QDV79770.1 Transposase DDE domain protein [Planctomycetes bacterium K2D]